MRDASLMQLMWLASPALPIGGFSYSECVEIGVDKGLIATESEATDWLLDQLHLSQSRGDLAVVAQAVPAWQQADHTRIAELNAWVLHTRESSELRAQTEQMGRSLLEWLRNHTTARPEQIDVLAHLQPTYPLAFALAASATGGCPHTAIREDASINLEAIDRMLEEFPNAEIVFIESGGDNLAATFSPELSDLTLYVIDVAAGEKIPRKGGPGITKSDLFVINKTDLASLRGSRPGHDESRHHPHAHHRQRPQTICHDQFEDPGGAGGGNFIHRIQRHVASQLESWAWKLGRVVDCTGLENRQTERFREFEPHRFRQDTTPSD